MKHHQINFFTAAPWTIPLSCQEAVSIRLLSTEGEVERQMVPHLLGSAWASDSEEQTLL